MTVECVSMKKPLTGWHVLIGMVLFFAVVLAVNITMITLGSKSFPGEDVKKSYFQGLNYNQTLRAQAAARALGWQVESVVDRKAGFVRVTVRDKTGNPVAAQMTGILKHPATTKFDRSLAFTALGDGRYQADVKDLTPGTWRLMLSARKGDQSVPIEQTLWVD